MHPDAMKETLNGMREFFNRSTGPLQEEHSLFAPTEGQFTVAGQVAHVAQTIEWFYGAAFGENWRMDFEEMDREVREVKSLAEARAWFERAVNKAITVAAGHSAEDWASPFGPNPIMGDRPRYSIIGGVTDHTAHHRGALTVYQRLLGLTPPMPYGDM
jgi:uncharacterized damage-inducible protein DinB